MIEKILMRITIIVEYLHARGGTQRQALELTKHLMEVGNDVTVFTGLFDRNKCFPEINKCLNIVVNRSIRYGELFRVIVVSWVKIRNAFA